MTSRNNDSQVNPIGDLLTAAHKPPQIEHPHILIAGLGNLLMKDDGAGVHAVRLHAEDPIPGAVAVEVGTAVLDAVPWLEWADALIAIDAINANERPGTVYRIDNPAEAKADAGRSPASLHDVNLLGALALLPPDKHPSRIVMIGVEPAVIDHGMDLTPAVEDSLSALLECVREAATQLVTERRT